VSKVNTLDIQRPDSFACFHSDRSDSARALKILLNDDRRRQDQSR
jgi:hypothetical protein